MEVVKGGGGGEVKKKKRVREASEVEDGGRAAG